MSLVQGLLSNTYDYSFEGQREAGERFGDRRTGQFGDRGMDHGPKDERRGFGLREKVS